MGVWKAQKQIHELKIQTKEKEENIKLGEGLGWGQKELEGGEGVNLIRNTWHACMKVSEN